jgi:hypothetical protein
MTMTRPEWFDEYLDAEKEGRRPNLTPAQIVMDGEPRIRTSAFSSHDAPEDQANAPDDRSNQ